MKTIPTLLEIKNNLTNDLKSKLNIDDSQLKEVIDVFTSVVSAQIKLLYLYLGDMQNNLYPDTADLSNVGGELNRLGLIHLNRQPRPATNGKYLIKFIGTEGSIVRAGITFKSNDVSLNPGSIFTLDSQFELVADSNDNVAEIRSLESGLNSLLNVGDVLVATEPIIGVQQEVEIVEIVELPLESESIDDYRKSIIDSIQLEPQGGSPTDYRLWAKDAQGVRNVYPYVKENNAGQIEVFVESTLDNSTDGNGTPSSFMIDEVFEVLKFDPDSTKPLDERGRKPMQAILDVKPIGLKPIDIDIVNVLQYNVSLESNIRTNLSDYIYDIRPFIDGGQLLRDKNDILNIAKVQGVVTDSLGSSNYFQNLRLYVDGVEVSVFQFDKGNVPYLRNINFI